MKALWLWLAASAFSLPALADLQVFPTRLLLTDKKRTGHLSLRHLGTGSERYRIRAVFYRMKPDGSLEQVEPTEAERPALKFLRFSPREVTLKPNIEQVLRVMIAPSAKLPDTEYRAHLHFEPIKSDEDKAGPTSPGSVAMTLDARVAIAIPVFFRSGQPKSEVTMSNLSVVKMPEGQAGFTVDIRNQGTRFVFGDLKAFLEKDGARVPVATITGISSYVDVRKATYAFNLSQDIKHPGSTLHLELYEPEEDGGARIGSTQAILK